MNQEVTVTVRPAEPCELPAVMNVLDAAMLEVDADDVAARIDRGAVLVAVDGERVIGACVASPEEGGARVDALAVRPGRRGQRVGSSLVGAATSRWGALSAAFDGRVRPFYESLGFEVEPAGDGRFQGWRRGGE